MTTNNLSVTRAKDRQKMAQELQALAAECGVACSRVERDTDPRAIRLNFEAPQGLCVTVSLDGDSWQPDVHVLSWYMAGGATAQLSDAVFGGNVNPYHRQKATYIASGFADLLVKLRKGLLLAVEGRAFLPEKEAA